MEIIEKNNSGKPGLFGVVILAAGLALFAWSLMILPYAPAHGFPWEFLLSVVGLKLVLFGGHYLESRLLRRNDGGRIRYSADQHSKLPFALAVIIAGLLLLGFNSGVLAVEWKRVFFSWQMLLIVVGLAEYAHLRITGGTVLVAIGGFFIIKRLALIYPAIAASGAGDTWWPVLLIIAGILILGGIFKPCHGGCHSRKHGCCNSTKFGSEGMRTSGVIDTEVVFGGCEQVYLDPVFRGGKIATVFGGVKLDLRRTELPEGETYLKVESVFGGIEIDAPEEWIIEIRSESIFGGFVDKRLPAVGPGYTDGRKLIIKASCVFGGGEIK